MIQIDSIHKILCLGAHCDDIELGCGGTILRLIKERPHIEFYWAVFSGSQQRMEEALQGAKAFLGSNGKITVDNFRGSFFPYIGPCLKESFEELKHVFSPDLIFTHYRHDLHQDHRLVSELTWNTFRDHLILEYEVVKYDGDLGQPNFYVRLDEDTCYRKIQHLLDIYKTQAGNHWLSEQVFLALLRLRGVESNTGYAEAFYCRKMIL